jgi:hypothetical protein
MTDTVVTLEEIAVILDSMTHNNPKDVMGFDMGFVLSQSFDTDHPCDTACCIGGWVQHLNPELGGMGVAQAVCEVSSLSYGTAYDLCFGETSWLVTPQQGAQAIRNAIEFDDPKWNEVFGLE